MPLPARSGGQDPLNASSGATKNFTMMLTYASCRRLQLMAPAE